MTTGRINQVTIFSRPRWETRFEIAQAWKPGGEFFDRNPKGDRVGPGRICDGAPPGAKGPGDSSRSRIKAPSLEARLCEFLPGRSSDAGVQALSGEGNECPTPEIAAFPQADPQS